MLPALPAGFEAELPSGGKVFLHHREDIGLVVLLSGGFELAETASAVELARSGTTAIDVGANVGMFTVPLALAVGAEGRVLAIEPSPESTQRLEQNVRLNELDNVIVRQVAVSDQPGELLLRLGDDPAFHSTTAVAESRGVDEGVVVRAETLDGLWMSAGEPEVSFVKIDTEGGELDVLRGATRLMSEQRPSLLVEAKGAERERELDALLEPWSYTRTRGRGFALGNFLCLPVGPDEARYDREHSDKGDRDDGM